jgi:2-C-methyl-D-erythritol 4-phosphate cytidylyltransferase
MTAAIIVAAGKGLRMQSRLPKQYHRLAGLPVVMHALLAFDRCRQIDQIVLVCAASDLDYCRQHILTAAHLEKTVRLVTGGVKRQASVYNGLQSVSPDHDIVVIHDGVRPLIRPADVTTCIEAAKTHGACTLGVPAFDTLKTVDASRQITNTLSRENAWLTQTPQAFKLALIKEAHERAQTEGFEGTDDAALVERLGAPVKMLRGSRFNLKITLAEDLDFAEAVLKSGIGQQPF